jgi:hypothetical protein
VVLVVLVVVCQGDVAREWVPVVACYAIFDVLEGRDDVGCFPEGGMCL